MTDIDKEKLSKDEENIKDHIIEFFKLYDEKKLLDDKINFIIIIYEYLIENIQFVNKFEKFKNGCRDKIKDLNRQILRNDHYLEIELLLKFDKISTIFLDKLD